MTNHEALMRRAIAMAETARAVARPNPWVGAVLVCLDGSVFDGATRAPGREHAEIVALEAARAAGVSTEGATLYCTLEPCSHRGRTGPCTEAVITAGIAHVVVAIEDPDPRVSGAGLEALRADGLGVTVGVCADEVRAQLAPYLHHRRTGRPFVVLKMATTLDGRTHLASGPRWITGPEARRRVHQLRAESDAIVVGRATIAIDDPELTVRDVDGTSPRRIVLTHHKDVPEDARVQPCTQWDGGIEELLDTLGAQGCLQLLVEGGPRVATSFHEPALVDRYVFHVAPTVSGDADALGVFAAGSPSLRRLVITSIGRFGDDAEIIFEPHHEKVSAQ